MDHRADRVFISYRRDDAAGYAGRLEAALEQQLGPGTVFRDVLDIAPGADFVAAIQARLASAQLVLVLIGPRWAGGELPGPRRIDDANDVVRMEVALALASDSGARVLPVLLSGARMPAEADLPAPLKPLARRHALSLSDTHWDADIRRLTDTIGLPGRRKAWPRLAAAAVLLAVVSAALFWLKPSAPADPSAGLQGLWQAEVHYSWGASHTERFEFKAHAGQLTGTASFLGTPRAIESLTVDGGGLRFETQTQQLLGSETRALIHRYSAERRGQPPDDRLVFRMQTSGAFDSSPPLAFEARRAGPTAASGPAR